MSFKIEGTAPPSPPPPPIVADSLYPSNADIIYLGKIKSSTDPAVIDRWWPNEIFATHIGSTHAPQGHYILDAFDLNRKAVSGVDVGDDQVAERPGSVAFFAGRIWWSGVRNNKYVGTLCYQENDPTSEVISDLLDTDGGVVPIAEAGHVLRLLPINEQLIVFASNGIWAIGGDGGFTATSFSTRKISNIGVLSPESIVEAESNVFFWSNSGIYRLKPDNITGYLSPENITLATIQSFYNNLPAVAKFRVYGLYDHVEKRIFWYYNPNPEWEGETGGEANTPGNYSSRFTHALVFDLALEAFYPYDFDDDNPNYVSGAIMSGSNSTSVLDCPVLVGGDVVQIDTLDDVIIFEFEKGAAQPTQKLLTVDLFNENFGFSEYSSTIFQDFEDWPTPQGYFSYMETGFDFGGTVMREKGLQYVSPVFNRTEYSYTVVAGAGRDDPNEIIWDNESSCLLTSKWDWTGSSATHKWSNPEQAYRLRDPYREGLNETEGTFTYDGGYDIVKTKMRVRGTGSALQLRFQSEGGKDMQLLGWEVIADGTTTA